MNAVPVMQREVLAHVGRREIPSAIEATEAEHFR